MTVLTVVLGLLAHGCGLAGAAGIAANFDAESRLNPRAETRSGLGLAQLSGARRLKMLRGLGNRWRDGPTQLAYLVGEMRALGYWAKVCAPGVSAADAAEIIMLGYERPRSKNSTYRRRRAVEIFQEMSR